MGARASYCCQVEPDDDFDSFRDTEGEVRMLIVTCDYDYVPEKTIYCSCDGDSIQRIAWKAGAEDITFMRDDLPPADPLFPTAAHVKEQIAEIGERSDDEDYFVFFYAGHGNSLRRALKHEHDGIDEGLLLPGPRREFAPEYCLVDDDLAAALDAAFPEEVRIMVITDCCHSGTMADVDSHDWGARRVCSFAACRDSEEATDTERGGVLSKAIESAVRELAFTRGQEEYSLHRIWRKIQRYARKLEPDQHPTMLCANLDPEMSPWPLPQAWWKNMPGTTAFKVQQEIKRLRHEKATKEEGMDAVEEWERIVVSERGLVPRVG